MQRQAKWWLLYATFPLSAGLLWLDSQLALQPREHQLLEMGIVLLTFGWMACWVHVNRTAMAKQSAAPLHFSVLPDPIANELPGAANWQDNRGVDLDKQTLIDLRGRYN